MFWIVPVTVVTIGMLLNADQYPQQPTAKGDAEADAEDEDELVAVVLALTAAVPLLEGVGTPVPLLGATEGVGSEVAEPVVPVTLGVVVDTGVLLRVAVFVFEADTPPPPPCVSDEVDEAVPDGVMVKVLVLLGVEAGVPVFVAVPEGLAPRVSDGVAVLLLLVVLRGVPLALCDCVGDMLAVGVADGAQGTPPSGTPPSAGV